MTCPHAAWTPGEALRALITFDVRWACDMLRPVYDATEGVDGRVSIEVDPWRAGRRAPRPCSAPGRPGAGGMTGKVAVITGASQGIGAGLVAGLVAGYRGRGWAVVATARTIKPSDDPGVLTITAHASSTPALASGSTPSPPASSRPRCTRRKATSTSATGCPRWGGPARSATSWTASCSWSPSPYITGEILHIDGGQIAGH